MRVAKSPDRLIEELEAQFSELGLHVFGGLHLQENHCAPRRTELAGSCAFLIGNAGGVMWNICSREPEFQDGKPDPLNRWTRRVVDLIANEYKCQTAYPFDEPYWPFQRIARSAAGIQPSPLGILIHPEFGLWHSMRALLIFDAAHEMTSQISSLIANVQTLIHPCDNCLDKPCLSACPAGAFTGSELRVSACFTHIDTGDAPNCMELGCRARDACPIGNEYRYEQAQVRFHMNSYRGNAGC